MSSSSLYRLESIEHSFMWSKYSQHENVIWEAQKVEIELGQNNGLSSGHLIGAQTYCYGTAIKV